MSYVDGFVIPIPRGNIEAFKVIEKIAGEVWMAHGALAYRACVAEDIDSGNSKMTFRQLANTSADETVVYGFIIFESKEHRDKVNEKAHVDPRMKKICDQVNRPYDADKIIFGGFDVIVDM